jgi:hypothetical protein
MTPFSGRAMGRAGFGAGQALPLLAGQAPGALRAKSPGFMAYRFCRTTFPAFKTEMG